MLHPNPFRSVPIQWWCWCWCCRQGQRKHCSTGCRRWSRRRRRIPPRVRQAGLWRARSFARHQVSRLSLVVMLLSLCLPLYVCSVVYSSIPLVFSTKPICIVFWCVCVVVLFSFLLCFSCGFRNAIQYCTRRWRWRLRYATVRTRAVARSVDWQQVFVLFCFVSVSMLPVACCPTDDRSVDAIKYVD